MFPKIVNKCVSSKEYCDDRKNTECAGLSMVTSYGRKHMWSVSEKYESMKSQFCQWIFCILYYELCHTITVNVILGYKVSFKKKRKEKTNTSVKKSLHTKMLSMIQDNI